MLSRRNSLFSLDALFKFRPILDLERGMVALGLWPKYKRQTQLHDLSNDILVMIFGYLSVKDVISVRQVNKFFHDISHHRIIWKRFLLKSGVPVHPLPPTSRHSFPYLSGLDAERLLLRATSLERNWYSNNTRPLTRWAFATYTTVFSMTTVPGGQYLIASVGTSVGTSGDKFTDYSLVIYAMDHPLGVWALARTRTRTKAYHLKARYTTIQGRRCIAIAYVRRDWGLLSDRKARNHPVDVSIWSGDYEIDAPIPIKYECVTLEVPLVSLETLSDPRLVPGTPEWIAHARSQPKPFRSLTEIRTRSQLMYPDIAEIFGEAYLAVVKRPNSILFKNISGGPSATLTCPVPDVHLTSKIFNIRLLPIDNAILVARRLDGFPGGPDGPGRKTVLEIYHAIPSNAPTPEGGKREWTREPMESEELDDYDFVDCTISDHGIPTQLDDSALPELYSAIDSMVPHPVTLFMRTRQDDLYHFVIFPERREVAPPPPSPTYTHSSVASHVQTYGAWHYNFMYFQEMGVLKSGITDGGEPRAYRALPGSLRSMIYLVAGEDITEAPHVYGIGRHWCRQTLAAAMPPSEEQAAQIQPKAIAWQRLPQDLDEVGCMLWDETIGRLFLAGKTGYEVFVLEYAKNPRLGQTLRREGPISFRILPDPDEILAPLPIPSLPVAPLPIPPVPVAHFVPPMRGSDKQCAR